MSTDDPDHADVYVKIAQLAREMSEHMPADTTSALDELVGNAVAHIPGAAYAGITVVARRGEEITTPAATGEHPRTLDALQHKHHQGPCYAAATEHDSYFISDLHTEERWPAFRSDAMAHTPIRSIASFTLFTTRDTVGALNLYAVEPDAFGQQSRDLGYVFAAHAAVVWAALQRTEQFQSALASRDIIGQAKGMVMERYNLDAIQAFELLRRLSQDSNTRIFDIADRLVRADHPPSPGGLP